MIHGKYINQGEELTDVLKVRQLSLCDAMENISGEADELDGLAVNIMVDLPLEDTGAAASESENAVGPGACESGAKRFTGKALETAKIGVDGKPVLYMGCGRILCDIDRFRFYIDQVGILPGLRNHGFGEFALRMLVDKANLCGAQKVWLKLPEQWASEEAKERALKFFTGMHFKFEAYDEETEAQAAQDGASAQAAGGAFANEGRWMAADIDDFHACCHH
ncbi:MAG: GNAT family N-acetyltransferase [Lachnospiraceae bacterium]|nr:GNAT family N-acetyltransferase [Lachnospiraceae bacterium]